MNTILIVLLCSIIVSCAFLGSAYIFFFKILSPYVRQNRTLTYEELYATVWATADAEFAIYENNIFKNGATPLNDASFKNYYEVISTELVNKFDKDFMKRVTQIMDETSFVSFIGALVNTYLSQKLAVDPIDNIE